MTLYITSWTYIRPSGFIFRWAQTVERKLTLVYKFLFAQQDFFEKKL